MNTPKMLPDLLALLPSDKFDTARAAVVSEMESSTVEPILPVLLEWLQDMNWPVAQVLSPFLSSIGRPLAPHIRRILATNDDIWKHNVIACVVAKSSELAEDLRMELSRIATFPTPGEVAENVSQLSKTVLGRLGGVDT